MKNTFTAIILLTLISLSNTIHAQVPSYAWARGTGNTMDEYGWRTCSDASGNVFVTGLYYSSTISFGTFTLTNSGSQDMFIVKYDASGNVLWARNSGGAGDEAGQGITTDASGNVYVTGYYTSPTVIFGTFTLTNAGSNDMFIVKYDPSGNVLWAKSAGGVAGDEGWNLTSAGSGTIYVTGPFRSPTMTAGTFTLSNSGNSDMFVIKYDASGNTLWATSAGSIGSDECCSAAIDGSGNLYITGVYNSPSLSFGTYTLTNAGGWDVFLTKYDALGNVQWAKGAGSPGDDQGWGATTDASGNVYATGLHTGSIAFGTFTLSNSGNDDMFLAKYDASGNVLWANTAGGIGFDRGNSAATDAAGNVYVTGRFENSVTFGAFTLNSLGGTDVFITKYDAAGNVIWALGQGSVLMDNGNSIATDASGNIYIAGWYQSTINFGTYTLTNSGSNDCFIARINSATLDVEEKMPDHEIKAFPNPSNGNMTITSSSSIKEIVVINMMGEEILLNVNPDNTSAVIDISHSPAGVYLLKITGNNNNVTTRKIILR